MFTLMNSLTLTLQEGPAETTGYMIAGYLIIFGLMAIYLLSLFIRKRNLLQEAVMYEELVEQQDD
jgi:hypothetical protein